jgi:hypothetical protein
MGAQKPGHKYGPADADVSPDSVLNCDMTYRLGLLKNSQISLVQLCKLAHVRDKDIDLDDFIKTGSGLFKYSLQVAQDLRLNAGDKSSQIIPFIYYTFMDG